MATFLSTPVSLNSTTLCDSLVTMPVADFAYSADGLLVNFGDSSSGASAWNWDFGDAQFSTQQHPTHTYNFASSYTVRLIATDSCGSDTVFQVITVMILDGMAMYTKNFEVLVYPNPTHEQVTITWKGDYTSTQIILTDLVGSTVSESKNIRSGHVLDLSTLERGIYIWSLMLDGNTVIKKLAKY